MIRQLIDRYKRLRTERYLAQTYQHSYAFVGMGQHSLTNLYPVLRYLGITLKYICITSERKARLIERKFVGVKATTSLDEILKDESVKGVLVSATPAAHFSIASQVLKSGKSLFIEKPPCRTLEELDMLIALHRQCGSTVAMLGVQKRYAPAIQLLMKRLRKETLVNYDLHYLTGAYPEGNALQELYIHPLDLVCYLFGKPEILACHQMAKDSYLLMLRHPHIVGTLELSTAYSWTSAEDSLKVCTAKGIYRLSQTDGLTYELTPSARFGIPIEKVRPHNRTIECLHACNRPPSPLGSFKNFASMLPDCPVYSQGFFNELSAFVEAVEMHGANIVSSLESIRDTYVLLEAIKPH